MKQSCNKPTPLGWLYFEPWPPIDATKIGLWHWNHQVFLASTIVPGDDLLVGLQICHLYGFKNQIQNFIGTGRATTQSLGRPSLSIPTLVSLNALFASRKTLLGKQGSQGHQGAPSSSQLSPVSGTPNPIHSHPLFP